jgi:hypothetical protein
MGLNDLGDLGRGVRVWHISPRLHKMAFDDKDTLCVKLCARVSLPNSGV